MTLVLMSFLIASELLKADLPKRLFENLAKRQIRNLIFNETPGNH